MILYKVEANKNITHKDGIDYTVNMCFNLGCWVRSVEGGQKSGFQITTQRACLYMVFNLKVDRILI